MNPLERAAEAWNGLARETTGGGSVSSRPLGVGAGREAFSLIPLPDLGPSEPPDWVWPGYIARGRITMLTGLWKAGKSTLLAHLLRDLTRGGGLVDKALPAPVVIASEEPAGEWANRRDELDLGANILLVHRESFARPDHAQWREFVAFLRAETMARGVGLVVFDTIASLWPVLNENDAGEVLDALTPLRDLSEAGAAVLLIAHPRKGDGAEGTATRGSGALPGFVDVIVELRRHNADDPRDTRRVLRAYGRLADTPAEVVVALGDDGYELLGERAEVRQGDARAAIAGLLPESGEGMTAEEVRDSLPDGLTLGKHKVRSLLNEGARDGHWERLGAGLRGSAYRYRRIAMTAGCFPPNRETRGPGSNESSAWGET